MLYFAYSCFHLVCMVYSELWLEQLDPMERMQSNMWCWRETALSLGDQPSCSIWGSTLQRGQSWDWYMQHWTLLWSVLDWHPPPYFRVLWHLESLKDWSRWNKSWVDIAVFYLKVQRSHGPLGQSVQWPVEEVTDPEPEDPSEFMALHSSSVPVTCSPVVQHTLIKKQYMGHAAQKIIVCYNSKKKPLKRKTEEDKMIMFQEKNINENYRYHCYFKVGILKITDSSVHFEIKFSKLSEKIVWNQNTS